MVDVEKDEGEKWSAIGSRLWTRPERKIWLSVLFIGCAVVYAVRAVMPLCVLAVSNEFHWNKTDTGTVLSSFFWGYTMTQVLGGYLSDRFGAEVIMTVAMVGWSGLTVLTPVLTRSCCHMSSAGVLHMFVVLRMLTGAVQGVHFPALNSLLSRRVSATERAFSLSFAASGSHFGTLLTGGIGSILLERLGWMSPFYFIGFIGLMVVVCMWFFFTSISRDGLGCGGGSSASLDGAPLTGKTESAPPVKVPWLILFARKPFWAIIIAQFCGGWSFYILLSWLPTYFTETFPLASSWVSNAVPWFVSIPCQWFAGWFADRLVRKGYSTTFVRKLLQSIAFVGCGLSLLFIPYAVNYYWLALALTSAAIGSCSFHHGGVVCNVQDIAPRHTGSVFGLMNTAGAIPGFVGVYIAGYLLQHFGSWASVFFSTSAVCFIGFAVFVLWASSEKII